MPEHTPTSDFLTQERELVPTAYRRQGVAVSRALVPQRVISPEEAMRSSFPPNQNGATTDVAEQRRAAEPLRAVPSKWLPPRDRFLALQEWEGVVIETQEEVFVARLTDQRGAEGDDEAEIWLDEVAAEDRDLVVPGAIFYWSIGYLDRPSGRQRVSQIRFRRLPAWSQRELAEAEAEAQRLNVVLEWDDGSSGS